MKKLLFLIYIIFSSINLFASEPLVAYKSENTWIILDHEGKKILEKNDLLTIKSFSESLFVVSKKGDKPGEILWGIMDLQGNVKIVPDADGIDEFVNGIAIVFKNTPEEEFEKKFGFIDRRGNFLTEYEFFDVTPFSNGLGYVWNNKERGYLNSTGAMAIPLPDGIAGYEFSNGYAAVSNPKYKVGYIDTLGNEILGFKYDEPGMFSEGLVRATFKGKIGYVDKNGKVAIPHEYYGGEKFSEDRVFLAVQGRKLIYMWALADRKGNVLTEHKYYRVKPMSEGLAAVKTDTFWEFIGKDGKVVLDNEYRFADSFKNGLAWASQNTKDGNIKGGFIDKKGKYQLIIDNLENVVDLRTNQRLY